MVFSAKFTDNGLEAHLSVDWQRLRAGIRNLFITVWVAVSLFLVLKAVGIDILAFFGF